MLEIKGMIRKLEAEKNSLELKVIKLNNIINNLKEISKENTKEPNKKNVGRTYPRKLISKGKKRGRKKKEDKGDENIDKSYEKLTDEDYENLTKSGKMKKEQQEKEAKAISEVPKNVQEFILKNKSKDFISLRDMIIEKFELNVSTQKIRKITGEKVTSEKYIGQIHYNDSGNYACNPSVRAREEKLTTDRNKVTCLNCKSLLNIYNSSDKDDWLEEEE